MDASRSALKGFTLCCLLLAAAMAGCDAVDGLDAGPGMDGADGVTTVANAFKVTETVDGCTLGTESSGALFEVCVPPGGIYDGTLIVYAHGFVFPQSPLELPDDELGGLTAKQVILSQGYAYAATSYYTNGLVDPQQGVKDLRELIVIFNKLYGKEYGRAEKVLLVGFSNGAFLSTVALEKHGGALFDGALASCGPIGEYERQIQYYGDVLSLFQYFFPGFILGEPDGDPTPAVNPAYGDLETAVAAALGANSTVTGNFLTVLAGTSSIVGADPLTGALPPLTEVTLPQLVEALVGVLRYATLPVDDAIAKLGGSPYENVDRVYGDLLGPSSAGLVAALNSGISRYEADPGALQQLEARYRTTGRLKAPLVALHNPYDPIVPFWQETLYQEKLSPSSAGLFHLIAAQEEVGHCTFTPVELQTGLAMLLVAVAGGV